MLWNRRDNLCFSCYKLSRIFFRSNELSRPSVINGLKTAFFGVTFSRGFPGAIKERPGAPWDFITVSPPLHSWRSFSGSNVSPSTWLVSTAEPGHRGGPPKELVRQKVLKGQLESSTRKELKGYIFTLANNNRLTCFTNVERLHGPEHSLLLPLLEKI